MKRKRPPELKGKAGLWTCQVCISGYLLTEVNRSHAVGYRMLKKKKVQRHSFSDDEPNNVRASFGKTANLVYANDWEISMPRLETKRKTGRYRDIPSGREKRPAERQRGREVMDVGKPTALHSLSLPGIVTPVSC